MIENRWDQSLSPGNEQAFYWGSAAADAPGTRNYMGVKSPAVDAMIAALLKAESQADFVSAVRALDRVLISGFTSFRCFICRRSGSPAGPRSAGRPHTSLYGYLPETWWRIEPVATTNEVPGPLILNDPRGRPAARAGATRDARRAVAPGGAAAARRHCAASIRPTARASPTASRAASAMRRPIAWFRPSPGGCGAWGCTPTRSSASRSPTRSKPCSRCSECCAPG